MAEKNINKSLKDKLTKAFGRLDKGDMTESAFSEMREAATKVIEIMILPHLHGNERRRCRRLIAKSRYMSTPEYRRKLREEVKRMTPAQIKRFAERQRSIADRLPTKH